MLHILKSLAAYLEATTTFDVFAATPCQPNLAQAVDATPLASSVASGSSAMLNDTRTDGVVVTNTTTGPYVGMTWTTARNIDGMRYYWPPGTLAPVVKVRSDDGGMHTVGADIQLASGWNVLRFETSQLATQVRVQYVSGGADSALRCGELEAYEDLRIEPKPTDFGAGGFHVLHPDLDLREMQTALVTVGDTAQNYDVGEMGNLTRLDRLSCIIGLHCISEDQLDRHTNWAKMILDSALSPDSAGTLYPGIPLKGIRYPLAHVTGGDWWSSGQKGWHASPEPVIRVAGVITAADAVDYWRGRVQMVGTTATDDVRANFTCGVFDYIVKGSVRAGVESPAQILHKHNSYLILESDTQFHAVQDALT